MDNTRELERAELHKTIWRIANDLRGSVDGWDFKSYVLGMLFYRFISENLTAWINAQEREAGYPDFDYATLSDKQAESARADMVAEKGFFILPSQLFANVRQRARQHTENLNEVLSQILKARPWAPTAKTTSRACSMTSTSTAASWGRRWSSGTRS